MSAAAEPRRALHVFATFGRGGPQVRTTQLVTAMGAGWHHDILAMDGDTGASALLARDRSWDLLPAPPRRGVAASARAFVRLLRARDPDLLLTYNWGAIEACAAARWLGWTRHVHHEEGFGPAEQQRRHLRRNLLRRAVLGRCAAVVVPSANLLSIARGEWRLDDTRAVHLPNGVDTARFAPPPPGAVEARPFTVGAVGGLRAEKDHATLLRAVAAMQQAACVRLVGDGPERPALTALAAELGLGARVTFEGSVTDPAPFYRQMDAFALSSRTEQMPISLLEAMATGLPVAATDVGDVRRMLPEGSRDGLAPAGDPMALARALDRLAADPGRRRREGEANRQHCERHYELRECLARYTALYERVARG
ncbi:MAG: glycosyltransferase family 4 protein [Planctomycetota bacterium]